MYLLLRISSLFSLPRSLSLEVNLLPIDTRPRNNLIEIEEEVLEPRTCQPRTETLQRGTIRVLGRNGVGEKCHASIIPGRIDDAIISTASMNGVGGDEAVGW